jgi:hypothetical protein
MSRTLLLDGGFVALADELLRFRTTLGAMQDGIWPCDHGNLHDNPVVPTT